MDWAALVRRGHFVYESGDHGDVWLTLERLFTDPRQLKGAAEELAQKVGAYRADLVCGPLVGGALVAQWVAAALGARFLWTERHGGEGGVRYVIPSASRGLCRGARALVVDDAINAASAVLASARELRKQGATVVATAGLIVRASSVETVAARAGVPLEALNRLEWNLWRPDACPLCAARRPLTAIE